VAWPSFLVHGALTVVATAKPSPTPSAITVDCSFHPTVAATSRSRQRAGTGCESECHATGWRAVSLWHCVPALGRPASCSTSCWSVHQRRCGLPHVRQGVPVTDADAVHGIGSCAAMWRPSQSIAKDCVMAQVAQFCAADGSTLAMGQPVEMQVRERVFAAMCIQPCHAATATPVGGCGGNQSGDRWSPKTSIGGGARQENAFGLPAYTWATFLNTAVLPKIPHSNSCKRRPNRPLRPRRGRFGTLFEKLRCGIFRRRTAVLYNHSLAFKIAMSERRRLLLHRPQPL